MKIGLSSYSLREAINRGEMDILGVIRWIAENGGEHVEIVPTGFTLTGNPELVEQVRRQAAECGIDLSSYTIGANFITVTEENFRERTEAEYRAEIERVKREVEIGAALGVKLMRHDGGNRPVEQCGYDQYEKDLPKVADACREVADFAAQFGIVSSIENHGKLFQGSERVRRLVRLVDRPNYRTTLDVGNFAGVDEESVAATMNNIDLASMVHFKDFYIRKQVVDPENWHRTAHGKFYRGAIHGWGDLDLVGAAKVIRESGFDGYVSLEFESREECKYGCRISLDNVKKMLRG